MQWAISIPYEIIRQRILICANFELMTLAIVVKINIYQPHLHCVTHQEYDSSARAGKSTIEKVVNPA
ncbi:transglutaminase-like domain-containing protein [Mucilaginibacter oryzae]|uniref:transglutaminase-like domain-containing protein n=1 Tax=Mucilaginibacter oryzae TaxID=468058 RepID=UPI0038B319AA